ncbi:ABC transporter ATP-binding protein/permease [Flavobacterium agricola]|uniref:ABC transporter ATP-binding protein/permease n=1 Tax=Flavobacterium agricola TaxID=2870839 RepID=A0ABY6LY81_9FLAO|nr:ABC transporter ATP-binding protein [Flavobacterium agricola]UYW00375.1 ABC transporter ATP-binding protein/permease [Flavobacterium agricola]
MKELKHLNKYFYKYKFHFLGGILITIIAQIITLYAPKLIGESINVLENVNESAQAKIDAISLNIFWVIVTTLIAGFFTFLMRQSLIVMSRHIEYDLKNEIFTKYEQLSQEFYKNNRIGDLMNRISEDVGKVRQYTGPAVMYTINTFIRFAVVLVQMYIISPKLTFYTLIPLPLLSYFIYKVSTEINIRSGAFQANLSTLSSFTQETFSGIHVVKANGIEQRKFDEVKELSKQSKEKNLSLVKVNALFGPLMILLIGLSNLIVIYIGGKMYIQGTIADIGIIAQFILYINMLIWPVASLGWVSTMIKEAEASQQRINEFLKVEPTIKNTVTATKPIQGAITFNNVTFTYPDTGITALKNVSFHVNPGETLAILGNTGSGKSTILNLISRLYDTNSGEVLIDGIATPNHNLYNLRYNVAVVPQDAFLFSDTIANNIKFGKKDATQEEIENAAKTAHVHHNIIDFKKGYKTILGERGISLSGGQKQRISIARAIIKDVPILLFDDCLSAVDVETEEAILKNLKQSTQNKTAIIVTHRISAAFNADKIIVLDDYQVAESGTHDELIALNGYYKNLFEKQIHNKK